MKSLFISGPIRAATPELVEANMARGRAAWWRLTREGIPCYCPHLEPMWATYDMIEGRTPGVDILVLDLYWIGVCDGLFLLPGWGASMGAKAEIAEACRLGKFLTSNIEEAIRWAKQDTDIPDSTNCSTSLPTCTAGKTTTTLEPTP